TWASPELRSFVGYAPVLDALANLAASSGNPYAEAKRIREAAAAESVWRLLHDIVFSVAERETAKFAANFGENDEHRESLAKDAYGVDEQIRLLLAPTADEADVRVPAGIPDAWIEDLVGAVRQQLREHPYLR